MVFKFTIRYHFIIFILISRHHFISPPGKAWIKFLRVTNNLDTQRRTCRARFYRLITYEFSRYSDHSNVFNRLCMDVYFSVTEVLHASFPGTRIDSNAWTFCRVSIVRTKISRVSFPGIRITCTRIAFVAHQLCVQNVRHASFPGNRITRMEIVSVA